MRRGLFLQLCLLVVVVSGYGRSPQQDVAFVQPEVEEQSIAQEPLRTSGSAVAAYNLDCVC